mmetsp:Transcript_2781/g.6763  ORF Transcript_2781/g.6763 Transcript_2781/m.6763 type:complete len:295 (+) Transcript_2781:476-1360(+)
MNLGASHGNSTGLDENTGLAIAIHMAVSHTSAGPTSEGESTLVATIQFAVGGGELARLLHTDAIAVVLEDLAAEELNLGSVDHKHAILAIVVQLGAVENKLTASAFHPCSRFFISENFRSPPKCLGALGNHDAIHATSGHGAIVEVQMAAFHHHAMGVGHFAIVQRAVSTLGQKGASASGVGDDAVFQVDHTANNLQSGARTRNCTTLQQQTATGTHVNAGYLGISRKGVAVAVADIQAPECGSCCRNGHGGKLFVASQGRPLDALNSDSSRNIDVSEMFAFGQNDNASSMSTI